MATDEKLLPIYVPRPEATETHAVRAGSAMVGAGIGAQREMVYYEGNVHGAPDLDRWEVRVMHAAGRLRAKYPTIAKGSFLIEGLVRVGTVGLTGHHYGVRLDLDGPVAGQAFEAWLGDEAETTLARLAGRDERYFPCEACGAWDGHEHRCSTHGLLTGPNDGCSYAKVRPERLVALQARGISTEQLISLQVPTAG